MNHPDVRPPFRLRPVGLIGLIGLALIAAAPDVADEAKEAARVKELAARTIIDPDYKPEVGDKAVVCTMAPRRGPTGKPAPTVCGVSGLDYGKYLEFAWYVEREAVEKIKRKEIQKLKDAGRLVELGYGTEVVVSAFAGTISINEKPPKTLRLLEIRPIDGPFRDQALYVTEPHVGRLIPAPSPTADSRAATRLRSAQNLEKAGKAAAAIAMYRQIVKDFPGSPQAKAAAARLKALGGK
jgi:hypothetical protein